MKLIIILFLFFSGCTTRDKDYMKTLNFSNKHIKEKCVPHRNRRICEISVNGVRDCFYKVHWDASSQIDCKLFDELEKLWNDP